MSSTYWTKWLIPSPTSLPSFLNSRLCFSAAKFSSQNCWILPHFYVTLEENNENKWLCIRPIDDGGNHAAPIENSFKHELNGVRFGARGTGLLQLIETSHLQSRPGVYLYLIHACFMINAIDTRC
uniref:Uncharacterized protein n=1 Tax=Nicotiana tabacum TaxID=4097 RepID=A0A1S3XP96_TOBAC|nr:PREDICTED: uncharacterized protein LOC107767073 [Nicotiana tabacum]